jgi:hypothetical protein
MSLRLPSRIVSSPSERALCIRRCSAANPSGPHASKNAACGFTTGTSGATMSSTRPQNSSKAAAWLV